MTGTAETRGKIEETPGAWGTEGAQENPGGWLDVPFEGHIEGEVFSVSSNVSGKKGARPGTERFRGEIEGDPGIMDFR